MIPKKYHAIGFLGLLVMLLLLGLQLLGFGLGGVQSGGRSAALASSASPQLQSSSSLNAPTGASSTLSPSQAYRHPIAYDKLTGATTNTQLSSNNVDILGAKLTAASDPYPIDHYNQQQQQQLLSRGDPLGNNQQQQQQQHLARDEFFAPNHHHLHGGFPPPPPPHQPPMHHPLMHAGGPMMRPMQPPPPHHHQHHLLTTQPPAQDQPQPPRQHHPQLTFPTAAAAAAADSLPSASSVSSKNGPQGQPPPPPGLSQPGAANSAGPVYYTPPIFAYNNNNNQNQNQLDLQQQQRPPLGVPEIPLSVDDYHQARLRQQQQQQLGDLPMGEHQRSAPQANANTNTDTNTNNNLLADPLAQQRHREQMLDRQLLFGAAPALHQNHSTAANYYPDPALYHRNQLMRAPYAHPNESQLQQLEQQLGGPQAPPPPPPSSPSRQQQAQARLMTPANNLRAQQTNRAGLSQPQPQQLAPRQPPVAQLPPPLPAQQRAPDIQAAGQQQQGGGNQEAAAATTAPTCARQQQQQQQQLLALEAPPLNQTQPVLFCNEDQDYPARDIMRALEAYATERTIEQLLPQNLIQMLLVPQSTATSGGGGGNQRQVAAELQRQLALDPLQSDLNSLAVQSKQQQQQQPGAEGPGALFPSANYEPLCRSLVYVAQPRRAKNIAGQWKVLVNLPGHKYRGIAVSQMVRVEECSRPNSECQVPTAAPTSGTSSRPPTGGGGGGSVPLPRSRCLQHYENQRLLSWSHQQGLHVDIFRIPTACSCHMVRR